MANPIRYPKQAPRTTRRRMSKIGQSSGRDSQLPEHTVTVEASGGGKSASIVASNSKMPQSDTRSPTPLNGPLK